MFCSHALELKKQKEIGEAAEKIRREKWIKEKTQEIKEMTVKGLEPDIQKLIAKHKAEIKKIKAMSQVSDYKIYFHVLNIFIYLQPSLIVPTCCKFLVKML